MDLTGIEYYRQLLETDFVSQISPDHPGILKVWLALRFNHFVFFDLAKTALVNFFNFLFVFFFQKFIKLVEHDLVYLVC